MLYSGAQKKRTASCILMLWINLLLSQTSNPPVLKAEGDQAYCRLSEHKIVTEFSIENNGGSTVTAVYIQISQGYVQGEDVLRLNGTHDISSSWNAAEAKLTLQSAASGSDYNDLVDAVKDVVFYSNNPEPTNDKYFSITIGSANYLPSTQHYYEFVPSLGIRWSDAKIAAENRNYFGIQGYLATILSSDEADISGKLATGVGWIGGSDQETEGTWKWVTGPEAGTVFWTGLSNGSSPNYANWNTNEPNNIGNEDYAHITDPSVGFAGSWNDLPNNSLSSGPFQAKGYVVEYGGTPGDPELNISASTRLVMPRIISAENSEACLGTPQTLSVSATVSEINWYTSETGTTVLFTGSTITVLPSNTTTYWIDLIPSDCPNEVRTPVTATVHQFPIILNRNLLVEQCDNDTLNDGKTRFNLNALGSLISQNYRNETFEFYTNPNYDITSLISNPSTYQNTAFEEVLFVKTSSVFGCSETSSLTIKVGASLIDSTFFIPFETCETEIKPLAPGIESWDRDTFVTIENALTNSDSKFALQSILITFYSNQDDAELRQNGIVFENESDTYLMETRYLQDLWARVDNLDLNTISCLGIQKVASLKVNQLPEFERVDTNSIVCLNLDPITLEVASSDNRSYRYNWTKDGLDYPLNIAGEDAQVLVYEGGTYEVNATTTDGTACSKKIRMVLVSSEIATLTQDDLTVIDLEGDTGSVEINTLNLGVGDYEFALEDPFGPFQDDPYFENILPGIYKVYIQDKNGCGIAEIETSILGHMKFFSPNGDGINDFWKILGVSENFQSNSRVYVYDRNGKLLVDLDPLGVGWDGTYNGFQLPQDDYWFRVFFDNGKESIGHFSLLRPE